MPLDRNHFRRSRDAPTVWNGYLQTSSRSREVNPANQLDAASQVNDTQGAAAEFPFYLPAGFSMTRLRSSPAMMRLNFLTSSAFAGATVSSLIS